MFTGIIEATAKVLKMSTNALTLERPKSFDDINIGSSIAVSGVCLSIVSFDQMSMSFDVVETTFEKTKLGELLVGDPVNLERAMKANGRFEGHMVLGHCEGVGRVGELRKGVGGTILLVQIPTHLQKYIVLHGSIAIDGVALTVAGLSGAQLSVALIPHTLSCTTLGLLSTGDAVNIETDILGKYILTAHDKK